jgi:hypothetical protein
MKTDETLIYDSSDNIKAIPQKLYEELIKNYYFNKELIRNYKNEFNDKYFNLIKENDELKKQINNYNLENREQNIISSNNINRMKSNENEKKNNNSNENTEVSVSSIFKKKSDRVSEEKNKKIQEGGNKEDNEGNETIAKKSVNIKDDKKVKTILKKRYTESETEDSETESDSGSESSSSYNSDGDIYRTATATDDGVNKVYKKINNEMDYIQKKMRGGKMQKREVVNRINFLLNGLRILDKLNKDKKKRRH